MKFFYNLNGFPSTDDSHSIRITTDTSTISNACNTTSVPSSAIQNLPQPTSSADLSSTSTTISVLNNTPSSTQLSSNITPVPAPVVLETLKACFLNETFKTLHSTYNCQNKCMNMSPLELGSQKHL